MGSRIGGNQRATLSPRSASGSIFLSPRGLSPRTGVSPRTHPTLRVISPRSDTLFFKVKSGKKVVVFDLPSTINYADLAATCERKCLETVFMVHFVDEEGEFVRVSNDKDLKFVLDARMSSNLSIIINKKT